MISNRKLKRYSLMLKGLESGVINESILTNYVTRCVNVFSREDRIIWALNKIKYNLTTKLDTLTIKQKRYLARFKDAQTGFKIDDFFEVFEHFFSQNGVFDDLQFRKSMSVEEVTYQLENEEARQQAMLGDGARLLDEEGEMIAICDDNLIWFDLKKSFSIEEKNSMRHCGNSAGHQDDTIYSLREKVVSEKGEIKWIPHLTFIYNRGRHCLGEMKARFNQNPKPKFHNAIVDLLIKREEISLLAGGGYKAENNFALDNLSEDLLLKVANARPELIQEASAKNTELYETCLKGADRFTKTPWAKVLLDQQAEQKKTISPSALLLGKFSDMVKTEKDIESLIGSESWIPPYLESFIALGEPHKELLGKTLEAMVYADVEDIETILYQYLADIERTDKIHMNHLPDRTMQILISLDSDSAYQLLSEAA